MRWARNVAIAIVAFVASFVFVQWWDFGVPSIGGPTYQGVFLINGQAYFGRFAERLGPYVRMETVYYIQQRQDPEDPDKPPDARLVRRGTEPHQPVGGMLIPRSAITFVEDLRPTSPIGTFIDQDITRR